MASSFHLTIALGDKAYPEVRMMKPFAAETFVANELVYYDAASAGGVKQCGADPALILGIAMSSVADALLMHPLGLVPVAILTPNVIVIASSTVAPSDTNMYTGYGIVRTSAGLWQVDTTDTTNLRVMGVDYAPKAGLQGQESWYIRFLAANLQGDQIAS